MPSKYMYVNLSLFLKLNNKKNSGPSIHCDYFAKKTALKFDEKYKRIWLLLASFGQGYLQNHVRSRKSINILLEAPCPIKS